MTCRECGTGNGMDQPGEEGTDTDLLVYQSQMLERFAWHQRLLLHPALRTIRTEGTPAAQLQSLARTHTLIYITPQIGTWEYLFCNLFCLDHQLPLGVFATGLSTRSWQPFGAQCRATYHALMRRIRGPRDHPDPVRSSRLRAAMAGGRSVTIRLKTTALFDDRFWDDPIDDPLLAVIQAHHDGLKPIALIPMQFLWSPRPDHSDRRALDILLGDRSNPGRVRKLLLFLRNFRRVVAHIGTPIDLRTFIGEHAQANQGELAAQVRAAVLTQFSQQRKSFTGPALKPKHWMVEQIVGSPRVQRALYDAARAQSAPVEDLQLLARSYATEIAADVNYTYVEMATRVLHWVFRTIYDGITTDLTKLLDTIRTALERGPVVLVPNHRSHTDYLILSHLLYKHGVALPYVAAGNNLSYWPLGAFFRRVGAFFLRRSFAGNPLYRTVFAEYLRLLVTDGHCIEFFIEGGRSRTGKLLMPRHGFLSMLTEAIQSGAAPQLTFIPVAVTYDRVIEQQTYLSEVQGAQKPRESLWDMLHVGRYLRRHYGKIYLQVGAPIEFAAAAEPGRKERTAELATQIMRAINRQTVVTPIALVATALLAQRDRATTEAELLSHCDRLLDYLRWRGAALSEPLQQHPDTARIQAIQWLRQSRCITQADQFQPTCYVLDPAKRAVIDFSKNTIVHFFITASCVAVSLRAAFLGGAVSLPIAQMLDDVQLCQELFDFEFRFATRGTCASHVRTVLDYYAEQGWVTVTGDAVALHMQGAHHLRLFAVLLRNYFESYKAAFLALKNMPEQEMTEKDLLKHGLAYAKHLLLLGQIRSPEAISQFNFRNALLTFGKMGLLHSEPAVAPQTSPTYQWISTHPQGPFIQAKLEQWC